MQLLKKLVVLFFLFAVAPACLAAEPAFSSRENSSNSQSGLPIAPAPSSVPSELHVNQHQAEDYRIQPEDVIQIAVYEEPELTTRVRVSGSGEVNFPLLGRITVAGLTVGAVQEKVTKALGDDYLVNPQVQVFIDTYHARNVFVTGAVNRPGAYPLDSGKRATLMETIAMAGGFRQDAAMNSIRVIRVTNGKENTFIVKAKDIIQKGDKTKDVEVLSNDVVFVPESIF